MKTLAVTFSFILTSLFYLSLRNDVKRPEDPLNKHRTVTLFKQPAGRPDIVLHNFIFSDDKGNKHPLFDSTKKMNMVVFWASWCSPCRMEIPNLKEIYKGIDMANFRLISISVDKDKDAWLKALKEEQMPWPQLWAEGDNVKGIKADFGFTGIPQIYFIDNKGKVLASYTGYHYDEGAGLRALVKQYGSK